MLNENIERIHRASMHILEKCGVVFHHDEAVRLLKNYGVTMDGHKAFFTEKQIMELVGQAPKSFTVTPWNESRAIEIKPGRTNWATAGGASNIIEADSSPRPTQLADFVDFVKIAHGAPVLNTVSSLVVQAADLPPDDSAALNFFYASQLTDKALVAISGNQYTNETVLGTAAALYGGLAEFGKKPRVLAIISTISPLQLDENSLEALITFIRAGQPCVVTPCTMAGSTGPMTLAGSIALSNAETLAGLALSQIIKPGAPVVYGCQSTTSDPKTAAIAIGAPEQAIFIRHGAAMAAHYGLPSRGGGLLTDADRVGVQSGYEAMMTGLATRQAGFNLALHGAGIVAGYAAISFEQFIVDLEILGMIETLMNGIEVDDKSLALDVVQELGSAGGYLTHTHTLKNCRKNWLPKVSHRGPLGGPAGQTRVDGNIAGQKLKYLESYQKPDLPPGAVADMEKFLTGRGIGWAKVI